MELVKNISLETLLDFAYQITKKHAGNKFSLCSIVNAKSGGCEQNCAFCSQSAHHKSEIKAYPLQTPQKLLEEAKIASSNGALHFSIVTSGGKLSDKDFNLIYQAVEFITQKTSLNICASLGQLDEEKFNKLKKVGLSRYHHNLETSKEYYPKICTTQNWQDRVNNINLASSCGLEVCSGGLFGLGESWEDRISLAFTLKENNVKNIPLNFFNPRPDTPLADTLIMSEEEALRIIAIFRLILPEASLRICGGRPQVFGNKLDKLLSSGINSMMTGNYLTTNGVTPSRDIENIKNHDFFELTGVKE